MTKRIYKALKRKKSNIYVINNDKRWYLELGQNKLSKEDTQLFAGGSRLKLYS